MDSVRPRVAIIVGVLLLAVLVPPSATALHWCPPFEITLLPLNVYAGQVQNFSLYVNNPSSIDLEIEWIRMAIPGQEHTFDGFLLNSTWAARLLNVSWTVPSEGYRTFVEVSAKKPVDPAYEVCKRQYDRTPNAKLPHWPSLKIQPGGISCYAQTCAPHYKAWTRQPSLTGPRPHFVSLRVDVQDGAPGFDVTWDWGDGTVAWDWRNSRLTNNWAQAEHTYEESGTYVAQVRVEDALGHRAWINQTIEVTGPSRAVPTTWEPVVPPAASAAPPELVLAALALAVLGVRRTGRRRAP